MLTPKIQSNMINGCVHCSVFHWTMKCMCILDFYFDSLSIRYVYSNRTKQHSFNSRWEWIRLAGVEDFLHLSVQTFNKEIHLYSCHFAVRDMNMGKKLRSLKNKAVPSIFNSTVIPLSEDLIHQHCRSMPVIEKKIVTTRKFEIFIFSNKNAIYSLIFFT